MHAWQDNGGTAWHLQAVALMNLLLRRVQALLTILRQMI